MPTVLRCGPYRMYFWSNEGHEPAHVHVERGGARAKFWLGPPGLAQSRGFSGPELTRIMRLIAGNAADLQRAWDEHFGT